MFVDRCKIEVYAGSGGDGAVSFRREKYVPRGGPDGGNGGDGGSVIARVDPSLSTLLDFRFHVVHRAANGQPGKNKTQHGRSGKHVTLRFPPGTVISDADTGEHIADLLREGDTEVLAKGGAGGLGNDTFKSATNQAPRTATPGQPGEDRKLLCELKLIADVGLVGLPNAGTSTLLRSVSRATPKVADYPFTTLTPQLGIAELDVERRLVVADIPGLIEGAAEGAGLGHRFLRHVERTRVLVHLVDLEPADGSDPASNYRTIRDELAKYSPALASKPELLVVSKLDLLGGPESAGDAARMLLDALRVGAHESNAGHDGDEPGGAAGTVADGGPTDALPISAASGFNVAELLERVFVMVERAKAAEQAAEARAEADDGRVAPGSLPRDALASRQADNS